MQRIMIMGCGGAGKTTLANRLGKLLQLEIIYLDQYYWAKGWDEDPPEGEEWEHIVNELLKKERWVMDGNYGGTKEMRFEKADTIIFLDRSRWVCLWRVIKRTLKYWRQARPHMPETCPERFDWEFTHYILSYNDTRRPALLQRLKQMEKEKQIFILKSDKEVDDFIATLSG